MDTLHGHEVSLLTHQDAAKFLRISTRTLARWTSSGKIPYLRTGPRLIRFRIKDLQEWLDRQMVGVAK